MTHKAGQDAPEPFDVVVVGAGFAGIQALHRFREQGLRVVLLDAADGPGGTWYWNRYPGARVDIEGVEYSMDVAAVQDEWEWSERYAGQPELLRYFNFAVDRLQLRPHMRFGTRLDAAKYDDSWLGWELNASRVSGRPSPPSSLRTQHLVLATGFLSAPIWPQIDGLEEFAGHRLHTAAWPSEGVDLDGLRVGVIGTAASGIQVVQSIADQVGRLSVFQRTASWAYPLRNGPMDLEYQQWVKERYDEIRHVQRTAPGAGRVLFDRAFQNDPVPATSDCTKEEVFAEWERRWAVGGPGALNRTYSDLVLNEEANGLVREFWTEKIKQTVADPVTAAKLVPSIRPLTRRPPGEEGYFAAFNKETVELVDVAQDPIDRVIAEGVLLASGRLVALDVLICATGFDAGSGAALRIDIRGKDGLPLRQHWEHGARTYLGLLVSGFPNMYLLNGPQSPSVHFNPAILAGVQIRLLQELFERAHKLGANAVDASLEAEDGWSALCSRLYDETLIIKTDSWWLGTNVPGKPRRPVGYRGGLPAYLAAAQDGLVDGSVRFAQASGRGATTAARAQ